MTRYSQRQSWTGSFTDVKSLNYQENHTDCRTEKLSLTKKTTKPELHRAVYFCFLFLLYAYFLKIMHCCFLVTVSFKQVINWVHRFEESGLEGLENKDGRGRKSYITDDELELSLIH